MNVCMYVFRYINKQQQNNCKQHNNLMFYEDLITKNTLYT